MSITILCDGDRPSDLELSEWADLDRERISSRDFAEEAEMNPVRVTWRNFPNKNGHGADGRKSGGRR